jgi:hypothetical protein
MSAKAEKRKWHRRICWWTGQAGRGILLAWRKNQLMMRGGRRESKNPLTGGFYQSRSPKC